jgi:putative membrane protein insertion efficiency factor
LQIASIVKKYFSQFLYYSIILRQGKQNCELIFLDRPGFYVIIFAITNKGMIDEKAFKNTQQHQGQACPWISSENEVAPGKKDFPAATPKGKKEALYLGVFNQLAIALINCYQRYISGYLPSSCRFYPSCSEYAKQAITKYGLTRGALLAWQRLKKCHPFSGQQGCDPVK